MSWDYMLEEVGMLRRFEPERQLPIWNTEGIKYAAWTDRPNIPHTTAEHAAGRMNRNMALPQRLAAAYAVRNCVIEFSSGANVLFLWEFRNSPYNANIAHAGALALMDWFGFDGTPQAKLVAINALAEKLHGATPVEHFALSPRVRCALFQTPSGPFCAVWRANQDENDLHGYALPVQADVVVQDMFGRQIELRRENGGVRVPVSEMPVYVMAGEGSSAQALATALKEAGRRIEFPHDGPLVNPLPRPGDGPWRRN